MSHVHEMSLRVSAECGALHGDLECDRALGWNTFCRKKKKHWPTQWIICYGEERNQNWNLLKAGGMINLGFRPVWGVIKRRTILPECRQRRRAADADTGPSWCRRRFACRSFRWILTGKRTSFAALGARPAWPGSPARPCRPPARSVYWSAKKIDTTQGKKKKSLRVTLGGC